MAGLDQRLSVYEDGRVALEDRKARSGSEIQAEPGEIDAVRSLIDEVPEGRWHGLAGAIGRGMLPRPHESMRFELRRGSKRIHGAAGRAEADLVPLLAELDELLARAVRERRA